MAITSANLQIWMSGGAANTSAAASLGGAISTAGGGQMTTGVLNNLWDDVSSAESSAGDVEHRCFYIKNAHATLTLTGTNVVWISVQASGGHTFAVGTDAAVVSGTATTIATETAVPSNVTFSSPTSKAASTVTFPDLAPGQFKAIWVRRTVTAGSGAAALSATIQIEGTTLP